MEKYSEVVAIEKEMDGTKVKANVVAEEYIPVKFSIEGWALNVHPSATPAIGQRLMLEVYGFGDDGSVKCRWVVEALKETP